MSFLQSSEWTFTTSFPNPEAFNTEQTYRKLSYDFSNISTRKDSNDSIDLKFKYKTEVCKYWINGEHCPFQNICSFAHGFIEKRSRENLPSKYKTKQCKNFSMNGFCSYGTRCQFLHRQMVPNRGINECRYGKLLNLAEQNRDLFFEYKKRLRVFEEISDDGTMKQLLGKNYFREDESINFQNMVLNGKPRLNSI